MVVVLNILMLVVDVAAIVWMARRNTPKRRRAAVGWVVLLGLVGVLVAPGGLFGKMAIVAWGLFVHVPIVLGATAVLVGIKSPWPAMGLGAVVIVLVAVGVDAFLIEPHWLEVSQVQITSTKVREPLKIAVVADLQTDEIGEWERGVLQRVADEEPDIVLFLGDYIQEHDPARHKELLGELRRLLKEVGQSSPKGMHAFAVQGNVDWPFWVEAFEGTGVEAITETKTFEAYGGIRLTALSSSDSRNADLKLVDHSGQFRVVFGHHPDYALGEIDADLLLAGHTHGGQVRLPLVGPLLTLSRVPRDWAAGVTHLAGGRRLIVSRGIGMERGHAPRLRFLCRPELVIVEIVPSE